MREIAEYPLVMEHHETAEESNLSIDKTFGSQVVPMSNRFQDTEKQGILQQLSRHKLADCCHLEGNFSEQDDENSAVEEDEQVQRWKQREREIFQSLNEEDQERYEYYRQGDLDKNKVKKLVSTVNPSLSMLQPDNPFIIGVKGLGKLYAGELVELAVEIRNERGEQGAIRPAHLREAYRRMQKHGKTPGSKQLQKFFSSQVQW
eukprot:jgi/Galph1/502/GphlegSOOS_G5199.1